MSFFLRRLSVPLFLILSALSPAAGATGAAPGASFAETLYPFFQHERCLACHQFNSKRSHGLSYTTHRNRYLCDTCHQPQLTGLKGGEWQAPLPRLDWTGLDVRDTCALIKRNAGSGDAGQGLRAHLLTDGRIHWALDSGMTPAGRYPTVDGGSAAWHRQVQAWLAGGMRCE
jgi:hypothetical protein